MARRFGLVLDANDPRRVAAFWAEVLGYAHSDRQEPDGVWIHDPAGENPPLFIQQVPEPKATKNRLHLDVYVSGEGAFADRRERIESAHRRLIDAGGSFVARFTDPDDYFVVLRDPEGNEFCLV